MKHFISTTLLLLTLSTFNLNAQQISATAYNKAVIHEDFNQEGEHFKVITTTDNYFILDKGDYLLSRNNEESEYAIIASNSFASNFVLKTSVRIGPSNNKKASLGVILKAQQDGKGAIIFEINKKGEYRIKQLLGNTYKILSGVNKQEGWVKNKIINGVDQHNFIEIRTENNIYDVYVNSEYLTTFFIPDYTSGACGLIISPETKARVAYYHLDAKGESNPATSFTNKNETSTNSTIEELNKKIATLESNNATLNDLNNEARKNQEDGLIVLKEKNADLAAVTIEQEKEIASLKRSITELKNSNSKIVSLETTITNNTSSINNLTIENGTLTTEVTSLNSTISNLNTKNSDLADVTIEQEKEISALKNNAINSTTKIEKLSAENKESNSKISSLTTKNSDLAAVTIEQEKEIKALTSAITNLQNNNSEITVSNKQLNKKITELKQQVTLEKSLNTELTNDLNKSSKSSKANNTALNNEVTALKSSVSKLKKENTSLTTNLNSEKSAHSKTKKGLSSSITSKIAEIKALTAQLNTTNQQLSSASKNGALAKKCAKNAATLSTDLKKANKEIIALQITKNNHDGVVNDLNSQSSLLKAKQLELNNKLQTLNKEVSKLETTNSELKELFILMDFEVNGVKPSEMIKQTSSTPAAPTVLKGNKTIYTVQFGVYMQEQSYASTSKLNDVWHNTTENGTYVYYSGEFNSPQEAANHKNNLISKGYKNAFVVTLTK